MHKFVLGFVDARRIPKGSLGNPVFVSPFEKCQLYASLFQKCVEKNKVFICMACVGATYTYRGNVSDQQENKIHISAHTQPTLICAMVKDDDNIKCVGCVQAEIWILFFWFVPCSTWSLTAQPGVLLHLYYNNQLSGYLSETKIVSNLLWCHTQGNPAQLKTPLKRRLQLKKILLVLMVTCKVYLHSR